MATFKEKEAPPKPSTLEPTLVVTLDPCQLRCSCGHLMSRVIEGGKHFAKCQNSMCPEDGKFYSPPSFQLRSAGF